MESMENQGQEGSATPETNEAGNVEQPVSNEGNVTEGQGNENQEGGKPDEGIVTREDGSQWIPKKRLDQVLAKMDELKNGGNFLETLKTDPEKRAEFMQVLSDLEKQNAEPQASPYESWVAEAVPQEAREHYMGMAKAFAAEQKAYVDSQLAPLIAAIGEFKLQQVSTKLPDFNKHQAEIAKVMKQYPGIPPEMAYSWVTRNQTFQKGKDAAKQAAQKQVKPTAPITNKRSNATPGNQSKTFAERLTERLGGND